MTLPATARLGEHVSFLSGFAFKSAFFNTEGEGLPIVRIRDVKAGRSDTYYSGEYDPKFIVSDGDYLIGMDGEFSLARWRGGKALLNQRVCKVESVSDRLDAGYLVRFLPSALKAIEDATPFVTVKHLSVKALRDIEIPLPPLAEQRRIAAVLDQVDALRARRRQAAALLADLAGSVFLDMFGGPSDILENWPTRPLGDALDFLTSGSRGWAKYYTDDPRVLFLRIQNVRGGELLLDDIAYVTPPQTKEAERTRVRAGDVLLSITADLGRVAVVPEELGDAHINQHLAILRAPSLNPNFLAEYISSPAGQRQILGRNRQAVKAGLNFDDVRSLRIPVPPRDMQDTFDRRLRETRRTRDAHHVHLARLDELFASLQQRAFTGQLWEHEPAQP
ncbi:restriction endonuclease subunit S [Streptomyces sp. NPDC098085]|uniref:restriction endonuclease subunit S n=1 Tax=Streptomyces sp. NPDC098085 TaxID=3366094 RepID=UPI00381A9B4C